MPRAVAVPRSHGQVTTRPAQALLALGFEGARLLRPLGGNANMHWLVATDDDRVVLRRYGPWHVIADISWEMEVLARVHSLGWRVPAPVAGPAVIDRHIWIAMTYVEGRLHRPRSGPSRLADQRDRGRLLAQLHDDLATITDLSQRPTFVRRDEIFGPRHDGPPLAALLDRHAEVDPDSVRLVRRYVDRTGARLHELGAAQLATMVIHGDLLGHNILRAPGRPPGIIDFDMTHLDHRVAEFAWTWRGHAHADEFILGYDEVRPLTDVEWELLTPAVWASRLDSLRMSLLWDGEVQASINSAVRGLSRRSPLMCRWAADT